MEENRDPKLCVLSLSLLADMVILGSTLGESWIYAGPYAPSCIPPHRPPHRPPHYPPPFPLLIPSPHHRSSPTNAFFACVRFVGVSFLQQMPAADGAPRRRERRGGGKGRMGGRGICSLHRLCLEGSYSACLKGRAMFFAPGGSPSPRSAVPPVAPP